MSQPYELFVCLYKVTKLGIGFLMATMRFIKFYKFDKDIKKKGSLRKAIPGFVQPFIKSKHKHKAQGFVNRSGEFGSLNASAQWSKT